MPVYRPLLAFAEATGTERWPLHRCRGRLAVLVYFAGLIGGNLVEGRRAYTTDVNAMVLLANVLIACVVIAEALRAGVTLGMLRGLR